MSFLDLRGTGEAGPQRMAGKGKFSFALGKVATDPGGQRGLLHQPSDMLVGQPFRANARVFLGDAAEQRAMIDAAEPHPGLEHGDGAGERRGAAADLDLAPAGLAIDRQQ